MSSVALLVLRNFVGLTLSWVQFLGAISYAVAIAGLVLIVAAALYFHRRLKPTGPADAAAQP